MPRSKLRSNRAILYTLGDPAGIGPEIIIKALSKKKFLLSAVHVIIADEEVLKKTKVSFKSTLKFNTIGEFDSNSFKRNSLNIINLKNAGNTKPGVPSKKTGRASLEYLEKAVGILKKHPRTIQALITLPVSKRQIELTGIQFKGHTEYLREKFKAPFVLMIFLTDRFDVLLYTRHVPLKDVARSIKKKELVNAVSNAVDFYRKKCKFRPRVAVLGLNPHAGENGAMGREEKDVIIPAIEELKAKSIDIDGPFAADGFFRELESIDYDLIVSMYHDQILPLVKSSFPGTVNFSLGLPFLRLSPDHGTAFDIAGRGIAKTDSLEKAIEYALKFKCR